MIFCCLNTYNSWPDISWNSPVFKCLQVLNYFSTRLEPLGTNPSSKDVLQTIKDAGMTFKKDKLKVNIQAFVFVSVQNIQSSLEYVALFATQIFALW